MVLDSLTQGIWSIKSKIEFCCAEVNVGFPLRLQHVCWPCFHAMCEQQVIGSQLKVSSVFAR